MDEFVWEGMFVDSGSMWISPVALSFGDVAKFKFTFVKYNSVLAIE